MGVQGGSKGNVQRPGVYSSENLGRPKLLLANLQSVQYKARCSG